MEDERHFVPEGMRPKSCVYVHPPRLTLARGINVPFSPVTTPSFDRTFFSPHFKQTSSIAQCFFSSFFFFFSNAWKPNPSWKCQITNYLKQNNKRQTLTQYVIDGQPTEQKQNKNKIKHANNNTVATFRKGVRAIQMVGRASTYQNID